MSAVAQDLSTPREGQRRREIRRQPQPARKPNARIGRMTSVYMSFGAGVQSTTLAMLTLQQDQRLLDCVGLELPEAFVFADTGDERQATYAHLWRIAQLLTDAGLPLFVVRKSWQTLSEQVLTKTSGLDLPPVFVEDAEGRATPVRRGCTKNWKVRPLDRWAKARYSSTGCVQWYGMSVDELERLKYSLESWRTYRYPLVEMGWTRADCVAYLSGQRYADGSPVKIVRSSCVYCPFHSLQEWREVAKTPQDWAKAIALDQSLRENPTPIAGLKSDAYVLRGRYPLEEFNPLAQADLLEWAGLGLGNDCEGGCGL